MPPAATRVEGRGQPPHDDGPHPPRNQHHLPESEVHTLTTVTTIFTESDVLDVLLDIVATSGLGARNPGAGESCRYTERDGTPSCIVAQVFERFGVGRPDFAAAENEQSVNMLFDHNWNGVTYRFSDNARSLLSGVQSNADNGYTWAEAVRFGHEDAS